LQHCYLTFDIDTLFVIQLKLPFTFSALTLLVWRQGGIWSVKT